jgi:hypothetical protein
VPNGPSSLGGRQRPRDNSKKRLSRKGVTSAG